MEKRKDVVLLVDDDNTALFIAEQVVKRQRITEYVLKAHNGVEALSLIRSACILKDPEKPLCPTIILVDVKMPVMDGYEFLKALRDVELPVRPIIIMLSSSSIESDMARARALNVDGYITKPLTAQALEYFLHKRNNKNDGLP